ncbi:MAG: glycosyltransferase family 39 protein, partial [Anaerolineales bacterium]
TEMLFTPAMLAGGVQAAAVMGWLIGLLALSGVWDLARAHCGQPAAWLAAASLLAGETLILSLGSGYVEWTTILYGLGMLATLSAWKQKNSTAALVFAGLCAGLALSSKYTAGVGLLGGLAVIALFSGNFRSIIRNAWLFGLPAVLVAAPYLVKNFVATGSAVYPLIFPTTDFDSTRMAFYNFAPGQQDWSRLLLLPWLATVLGVEKGVGYSASIGPILLAFSPLSVLWWRQQLPGSPQRHVLSVAAVILVSGFLIWAVGSQFRGLLVQTRLYMVIFPAWTMLAAAGFAALAELKTAQVRFGNVAAALAALAMIFAMYETINRTLYADAAGATLGLRSEDSYIERNLGAYARALDTMRALPEGSRVLMLWETRGFYCEPRCDSDEIIDRWFHDWRTMGNVEMVLERWRASGYTHLLLRTEGMNFVRTEDKDAPYTPSDWAALEQLMSRLRVVETLGGAYTLYDLTK